MCHLYTGAGVYVQNGLNYGGTTASQPNNTYIHNAQNYYGFSVYCCSGSTDGYIGSFTIPSGRVLNSNYGYYYITQYSNSSNIAGCIKINSLEPRNSSGVYTCNIPDNNGIMQHIGFTFHYYSGVLYYWNRI